MVIYTITIFKLSYSGKIPLGITTQNYLYSYYEAFIIMYEC